MFTIDELTYRMEHHEYQLVLQNDANEEPDYVPEIFSSVDEFRGSALYDQIADFEVTDVYAENDGTIWICYECDILD